MINALRKLIGFLLLSFSITKWGLANDIRLQVNGISIGTPYRDALSKLGQPVEIRSLGVENYETQWGGGLFVVFRKDSNFAVQVLGQSVSHGNYCLAKVGMSSEAVLRRAKILKMPEPVVRGFENHTGEKPPSQLDFCYIRIPLHQGSLVVSLKGDRVTRVCLDALKW